MTRINVGIKPSRLPDKALLAEHREIKRLPNHLAKHGQLKEIPNKFKLGSGHVKFLIARGLYTHLRYNELYMECIKRGFSVTFYGDAWRVYLAYEHLYLGYTPTKTDIKLIKNRLKERGHELR